MNMSKQLEDTKLELASEILYEHLHKATREKTSQKYDVRSYYYYIGKETAFMEAIAIIKKVKNN